MGHKSLETTMRYLVPATDVHGKLDLVKIPMAAKMNLVPRKAPARETSSSRKGRPVTTPIGVVEEAFVAKTVL